MGRMNASFGGEPLNLVEVNRFKYLWAQVAVDSGCKRSLAQHE